jgi:hypothetical protein
MSACVKRAVDHFSFFSEMVLGRVRTLDRGVDRLGHQLEYVDSFVAKDRKGTRCSTVPEKNVVGHGSESLLLEGSVVGPKIASRWAVKNRPQLSDGPPPPQWVQQDRSPACTPEMCPDQSPHHSWYSGVLAFIFFILFFKSGFRN